MSVAPNLSKISTVAKYAKSHMLFDFRAVRLPHVVKSIEVTYHPSAGAQSRAASKFVKHYLPVIIYNSPDVAYNVRKLSDEDMAKGEKLGVFITQGVDGKDVRSVVFADIIENVKRKYTSEGQVKELLQNVDQLVFEELFNISLLRLEKNVNPAAYNTVNEDPSSSGNENLQ